MTDRQQIKLKIDEAIERIRRHLADEAALRKAGERTLIYRMDKEGYVTRIRFVNHEDLT